VQDVPIAIPFTWSQKWLPKVKTLWVMVIFKPFQAFLRGVVFGEVVSMENKPFTHGFKGMCSVDITVHADSINREDAGIGGKVVGFSGGQESVSCLIGRLGINI
jgi:hypothetical protein